VKNIYNVKNTAIYKDLYKVRAIAIQAWTGLESSKSMTLPDFKIIGI
jgi:hypothetical protein